MNQWYPPSRPRAVENGLKARTSRGEIGSSWWSRRFIEVLESFAMGTGSRAAVRTRARAGHLARRAAGRGTRDGPRVPSPPVPDHDRPGRVS